MRWVGRRAGCRLAGRVVATFVPSTVSLTVLRVAAPPLRWPGGGGTGGRHGPAAGVVGVAAGLVVALVALAPETAEVFVDGSSYGDERRLPLRTPTPAPGGPGGAGLAGGGGRPRSAPAVAGGGALVWLAVLVLAAPLAWPGAPARCTPVPRWVVFVPAGLRLHDPLALAEPILLRRRSVRSLAAAPAGTRCLDLTAGAAGLALEARLVDPVDLVPTPAAAPGPSWPTRRRSCSPPAARAGSWPRPAAAGSGERRQHHVEQAPDELLVGGSPLTSSR